MTSYIVTREVTDEVFAALTCHVSGNQVRGGVPLGQGVITTSASTHRLAHSTATLPGMGHHTETARVSYKERHGFTISINEAAVQ
jgi:hypothetical protein